MAVTFGVKDLHNYTGKRFDNLTFWSNKYDRFAMTDDIAIIKVNITGHDHSTPLYPIRLMIDEDTTKDGKYRLFKRKPLI